MNEEEKEAIEKLSGKKNETSWVDTIRQIKREEITDVVVTRQKYITILLNLIKKLQKENEELKTDKKKALEYIREEMYVDENPTLDEDNTITELPISLSLWNEDLRKLLELLEENKYE